MRKIINYLEIELENSSTGEIDIVKQEILNYIKENHAIFILFDFVKDYNDEIIVYKDLKAAFSYVLHKTKKLYFPYN